MPVRERLRISPACQLILPYHAALDLARENQRGELKIGTTGRGIGPAYEDKAARRGVRLGDLFYLQEFAAKLAEVMDYHNFVLANYYKVKTVDFQQTLDETLQIAEQIRPMVADIIPILHGLRKSGANLLFEGAQGALLDIDLGTYPFVTSSNTTAGGTAVGSGFGPRYLDYILGITKAYSTRVGSGPFPTELFDDVGKRLGEPRRGVRLHHRTRATLRLVRRGRAAARRADQQHLRPVHHEARRARRPREAAHLRRLRGPGRRSGPGALRQRVLLGRESRVRGTAGLAGIDARHSAPRGACR